MEKIRTVCAVIAAMMATVSASAAVIALHYIILYHPK